MEKLRVLDLFAGYGGAEFALKKAGIEHECVGFSEIEDWASFCFKQNHGEIKNLGDCTQINVDDLPEFDLMTGGFPCQSFSAAGKGLGEQDTRGTLFHEIIRIAEAKKPEFMLLENVKGLTFKTHEKTLRKIISELKRIGYFVRWQVLNSKDFGVPQSRERLFFCCFRDVKKAEAFNWPEKEELRVLVKDVLDQDVDASYFLKENLQNKFKEFLKSREVKDVYQTSKFNDATAFREFEKVSPTLVSTQHDAYTIPLVVAQRQRNRHGRLEQTEQAFEERKDGATNTITSVTKDNFIYDTKVSPTLVSSLYKGASPGKIEKGEAKGCVVFEGLLRKLTPKECFRLMGFLNDEINLDGIPKTAQYKLAGNGWEINIVSKILKEMLWEK